MYISFFSLTDYFLHHGANAPLYRPLKRKQPMENYNVISSTLGTLGVYLFFILISDVNPTKSIILPQNGHLLCHCMFQAGLKLGAETSCK